MLNHKSETYNPIITQISNLHNSDVDYGKLGDECLEKIDLLDVYRALFGGKEGKGSVNDHLVQCSFHDDSNPSLGISKKSSSYHCYSCGASGNLIDFVKEVKKCNYPEAVAWLAEFGGLRVPERIKPAPTKINPKVDKKDDKGNLHQYKVTTYDYGNGFWVDRSDLLDDHGKEIKGKKDFYQKYEKSQHQSKLYDKKKHPTFPVYRLAEATEANPVWLSVVEGEKCADASWLAGVPAVTFMGTLKSVDELVTQINLIKSAGFTRLLYHIDADKPGQEKFQKFQQACEQVGGITIKSIDYQEYGDKFDGADYIEKFGAQEYINLVATAVKNPSPPKNNVTQLPQRGKKDFDKLKIDLTQLLEKSPKPAEIERFKAEFTTSTAEAKYVDSLVTEWRDNQNQEDTREAITNLVKDSRQTIKLSDVLPANFAAPIAYHAHLLNLPEAAYLGSFLATASRCLKTGSKVLLLADSKLIQPSPIYFCIVAESGAKKSPVLKSMCEEPFNLLQEEIDAPYKLAFDQYQLQLKDWESLPPKERKSTEEPVAPKRPIRLLVTSNTNESFQRHASEHPEMPYLIYNEELSGFFKNQNRYNRGSDKEDFLQIYDGGRLTVDRKSGVSADVPQFYLSILGATQPQTLQALIRERGTSSGEFARFLFTHMEQRRHNIPRPVRGQKRVIRDFAPMLADLYGKLLKLDPKMYELTFEAEVAFWEAFDKLDLLSLQETQPMYKLALQKAVGQLSRLALILHCVNSTLENPNQLPSHEIPLETMQKAIKLLGYFLAQTRLICGIQEPEHGSGVAPNLLRIIQKSIQLQESNLDGWLIPGKVVSMFSGKARPDSAQVVQWFKDLADMGLGEIEKTSRSTKFRAFLNSDNSSMSDSISDIDIRHDKPLYSKDFDIKSDNSDKNFTFESDFHESENSQTLTEKNNNSRNLSELSEFEPEPLPSNALGCLITKSDIQSELVSVSDIEFERAAMCLKPPTSLDDEDPIAPKCPVENQAKNLDFSDDRLVTFQVLPQHPINGIIIKSDNEYVGVLVFGTDNPFWGEDVFLDVPKVNVISTKPDSENMKM